MMILFQSLNASRAYERRIATDNDGSYLRLLQKQGVFFHSMTSIGFDHLRTSHSTLLDTHIRPYLTTQPQCLVLIKPFVVIARAHGLWGGGMATFTDTGNRNDLYSLTYQFQSPTHTRITISIQNHMHS